MIDDESAFLKALGGWDSDSGFTWVRDYSRGMNFSDYLEILSKFEKGQNLVPGYVADTSLFAFVENEIVGRVAIRHELNDFLLKVGGHIGYGVLPRFRKKGYAKQMLALALPIAKKIGIRKALVTCDDQNIGSIKTIEANGGQPENIVSFSDQGLLRRRYWIDLEIF